MKLFVMSDIHSFYNEMTDALHKQGFDINNPEHHVVICGDLFDRGPDAVKCLKFVKQLDGLGRLSYVCGNHEDLLFDCVEQIYRGNGISQHHFNNKTVDTIAQLTGIGVYDLTTGCYNNKKFEEAIEPILAFIEETVTDYVEVDDYVFVHGWIPCDFYNGTVEEDWRKGNWSDARWKNGMLAWKKGARLSDKTIVCGHWHCSWGWSNLRQERKEFPDKNRKDWRISFEPFVDEGIIALDACTAYTGMCNCLVIDVDE